MKIYMTFLVLSLLSSWARADSKATYSADSGAFTPPATPTDLCYIQGSATKKVSVREIRLSGLQNTAGVNDFFVIKRSTANSTLNTPNVITAVPHNSGSIAATSATVQDYTTNPSLGTTVGNIRMGSLLTPAAATVADGTNVWDFDYPNGDLSPPVLNGTGEGIAINFGGAALPTGMTLRCGFTWTEE